MYHSIIAIQRHEGHEHRIYEAIHVVIHIIASYDVLPRLEYHYTGDK
jgi:hypothetical protein